MPRGPRGGILLLWDKRRIILVESVAGSFSVSCLFRMEDDGFIGFFLGYMVRLRRGLEKPFGKSWVLSRAFGKTPGV